MSGFIGILKSVSHSQLLNGSDEEIFPLLCPVREYDWIDDWSCDLIHSESGFAEANCVFRTVGSGTRLGEHSDEYWIVSRFEPPTRIEFVKFSASDYVIKYEISLSPLSGKKTSACWTLHMIGLNEQGNEVIAARSSLDFEKTITTLETKLNYYLEYGECLKAG